MTDLRARSASPAPTPDQAPQHQAPLPRALSGSMPIRGLHARNLHAGRGEVLDAPRIRRLLGLSAPEAPVPPGLPALVVRPAQAQGTAWNDPRLDRSDLRADSLGGRRLPGVPLHLSFAVSQLAVGRCLPRGGVRLELWSADAAGRYADHVSAPSARHPAGYDTRGQDFLRGFQLTDAEGWARFTAVVPGWTEGPGGAPAAPRLHLRLQTVHAGRVTGEFSAPLFCGDALCGQVHTRAAYRPVPAPALPRCADDAQYRPELLLPVRGTPSAGLHAHLDIGLNV